MKWSLAKFNLLIDIEEYFEFFKLTYDCRIVNANRLHILKKFSHNIKKIDADFAGMSKEDRLSLYRVALQQTYEVFLNPTPLEQKLFKVFHENRQNAAWLTEINRVAC